MPASVKTSTPAKEKDRRKASAKSGSNIGSYIVKLRVPSSKLRLIVDPSSVKEESPAKESPETSATQPNDVAAAASNGDNASESNTGTPAGTPAPNGTPSQVPMGPPTEAPKKKGVKRNAATANGGDSTAKIRGKPGPKKKARL